MRDVSSGRLTVSITNTARRFDELRGHGGQLMGHSPVTIVIVFHVHSIASRLVSIARDPGSDVQWTVAKLNTFAFTRPKKANSVAIHDSKITQFQDDAIPSPKETTTRGKQNKTLAATTPPCFRRCLRKSR